MAATASQKAATNGDGPKSQVKDPKQIEAVKGEVVSDNPESKVLVWHGVDLKLPAELGAALMFDVFSAQVGDDAALMKAIYEMVGPEGWAKCRKVAAEEQLPAQAFHDLISEILAEYGMGSGEASDSADSSENGSG